MCRAHGSFPGRLDTRHFTNEHGNYFPHKFYFFYFANEHGQSGDFQEFVRSLDKEELKALLTCELSQKCGHSEATLSCFCSSTSQCLPVPPSASQCLPVPPSASHVWSFTKFHSRTRSCCLCTSAWTTRHQPWSCSHTFRFHPGPQHF